MKVQSTAKLTNSKADLKLHVRPICDNTKLVRLEVVAIWLCKKLNQTELVFTFPEMLLHQQTSIKRM